ncbi:MAG: ArnT family glycosyltransferase [Bacteroidota bacterium]
MNLSHNKSPYLLPLIAFLVIIAPSLLSHGMFFDGLTYASISRNLSVGDGDFFHLYYTRAHSEVFYDHPPLFFWIQSFFFSALGDHWWVEKLFCAVFFLINAILLVNVSAMFQKHFYGKIISSWPVVLLWLLVPITFWIYKNNVLEILLTTFTLLSLLCFARMLFSQGVILGVACIFGYSFFIFCACLTKGPVGLFPLAVPAIYILLKRNEGIKKVLVFYVVAAVFLFLLSLMIYLNDDFREYFTRYFSGQVEKSLSGERENASFRFKTFTDVLFNFFFPLFYSLIFILIFRQWKNVKWKKPGKPVWFFLLVSLSASLPVLISPKQREMYIAPAMPYFVLAVFFYFRENWDSISVKINTRNAKWILRLLTVTGLIYAAAYTGKVSRDREIINRAQEFRDLLPYGSSLCVDDKQYGDWKLHAYFQRYHGLVLERKTEENNCITELK